MELTITNLGPIEKAQVSITGLTVLAGPNEAGKSTIIDTLAAFFGGDPRLGLPNKGETMQLLRDKSETAVALLEQEAGTARILWPKLDVTGMRTGISEIARGTKRFLRQTEKERVNQMVGLLGATVTGAMLKEKLIARPIAFNDDAVQKFLVALKQQGWESLETGYKEKATEAKGAWAQVTGESWGSSKSQEWRPADWDSSLANLTIEQLDIEVHGAKAKLEGALGQRALSAEAVEKLKGQAGALESAEEIAETAEAAEKKVAQDIWDVKDEIDKLPPGLRPQIDHPCPHCGGKVVIKEERGIKTLEKAEPEPDMTDTALKTAREYAAGLQGRLAKLTTEHTQAAKASAAARQAVESAQEAAAALKGITPPEGAQAAVAAAQQAYDTALQRREAKKKLTEAERLTLLQGRCQALSELVSPNGIRKEIMIQRLEDFRIQHLTPLAVAAGLDGHTKLTLDEKFEASVGPHAYARLSRGKRYLVDSILQMAIARVEKAPIALLDDAEVLVGQNRTGFFKMVYTAKVPAVVALAVKELGPLEQIVRAGIGRLYWLESAGLKEVKKP